MYATCIHCKRSLESNEVVETFPVGRRLAFDSAKGRLWVVCRRCHPSRFLVDLVNREHRNWTGSQGYVFNMPKPTRLALEMSLHEEQERRALEGELWLLEQAWREAEEIADISDNLLLPEGTGDFIREHREHREDRGKG